MSSSLSPLVTQSKNLTGNYWIRTIKEEVIWLEAFTSLAEAHETSSHGITHESHHVSPHSVLGYQSPVECEQAWEEAQAAAEWSPHFIGSKKCLDFRGALQLWTLGLMTQAEVLTLVTEIETKDRVYVDRNEVF